MTTHRSCPRDPEAAASQARSLLRRALSGSRTEVTNTVREAEEMARSIWRRWQLAPESWAQKHVRWYLETCLRTVTPATRYRHWLKVSHIVATLGNAHWLEHLRGPWIRPCGDDASPLEPAKGGRPRKWSSPVR